MSILENMTFWQWWILAFGLLGIQLLKPRTTFFAWMGIGAAISGLVQFLAPQLVWQWQVIIFSVFSLAAIGISKNYVKHHLLLITESDSRYSAEKLLDQIFTLHEPIQNGLGKIHLADTTYTIEGEDMPGGSQVRVVGCDYTALRVSKVAPS